MTLSARRPGWPHLTRLGWTLRTLLSHWRRRPGQLATLLVGLALATALWSGVQALNQQARDSYDRAAQMLGEATTPILAPRSGSYLDQSLYIDLRRAGWKVSPVIEGRVWVGGQRIRVLGIDPVTLPDDAGALGDEPGDDEIFVDFLTPPGIAFVAPETKRQLGEPGPDGLQTDDGQALPPLSVRSSVAPGMLLVDIGVAQALLQQPGRLSRVLIDPNAVQPPVPVRDVVGESLRRIEPAAQSDLERLTDSFHLNLTAFGFLSFFVGLFIVHAAIGLAFEQRLAMFRTLRACGVSAWGLTGALMLELLSLALIAGLVGVVLGYLMAGALLPDVAASLRGLYGAQVPGQLTLAPSWWVLGLAISLFGALIAAASSLWKAYRLPVLAPAQPYAWREAQRRWLGAQGAAAVAILGLGLLFLVVGDGLVAGFGLMAALLLGAALLLPLALDRALRFGETTARHPLSTWFWADGRQQLSGLSLALMALLLALAVNIGVGTMVGSFRTTFLGWLDQRLAAEIYFDAEDAADAARITEWLREQPEVTAILPSWDTETRVGGLPIEVRGYADHGTYRHDWPMLTATPDAWDSVFEGTAILVSEQMAKRLDLGLGDPLALQTEAGSWAPAVAGIYPDYGNPRGQIFISSDMLAAEWPSARRSGYSLRVEPEAVPDVAAALRDRFELGPTDMIEQATLKAESKRIFESTFSVTAALNVLTLAVAGIAMFTSLTTLGAIRVPMLAPLWAMGVTRRRLALIELAKTLTLAVFTAALALPLGLAVAWCLVEVVNVEAFGWRLPLHLFPMDWLRLAVLAVLAAGLAAALPVLRLRSTPPARLAKVFADER